MESLLTTQAYPLKWTHSYSCKRCMSRFIFFFSCINKQISHLHQFLASSTKQLPSKEPTRSSCMQLSSKRPEATAPFAVFIQRFTKGTLARPRSFVPALLHPTQTQPSPRRRGLRTARPDGLAVVFWLSPTFGFVALTGYPTHRKLNTAKLHLILCGSL